MVSKWKKNTKVKPIRTKNHSRIEYAVNLKTHREDGPSCIYSNGLMVWYKNGNIHREDGPAVLYPGGQMEWFINGKRHREDGPALITSNGTGFWFKYGVQVKPFS